MVSYSGDLVVVMVHRDHAASKMENILREKSSFGPLRVTEDMEVITLNICLVPTVYHRLFTLLLVDKE